MTPPASLATSGFDILTLLLQNVRMSSADSRLDQVTAAALSVFGRYGYQRTSMELIAKAAGISRPALYQHFSGKDDIFRAAGERITAELISAAETAAASGASTADRVYGALAVKLDVAVGLADPRFIGDLIAEASARLPDIQASMKARHAAVIEKILDSAADLDVTAAAIPARDIAVVLLDALTGISQQDEPLDELRRRLRQLVNLTLGGLARRA
jgi:TetR/AcrR family transcriptional regulator